MKVGMEWKKGRKRKEGGKQAIKGEGIGRHICVLCARALSLSLALSRSLSLSLSLSLPTLVHS